MRLDVADCFDGNVGGGLCQSNASACPSTLGARNEAGRAPLLFFPSRE